MKNSVIHKDLQKETEKKEEHKPLCDIARNNNRETESRPIGWGSVLPKNRTRLMGWGSK